MPAMPKIEVEWTTRLCKVGEKLGYFHTWEHYSKPLPAGIFSKVFGIVEFPDEVQRVDPTDICFCDDGNEILTELNKKL